MAVEELRHFGRAASACHVTHPRPRDLEAIPACIRRRLPEGVKALRPPQTGGRALGP